MVKRRLNDQVNECFRLEKWAEARAVLERELEKEPQNHWIVTQLGVTYYEQRRYQEAVDLFLESKEIVSDCPLTLWNLAGGLDALGKHSAALSIFTWLLQSRVSPSDDPCWESVDWSETLKADCIFRIGVCLQNLGKKQKSEQCFRQYLNLLAMGIEGLYSLEDVKRHIQTIHAPLNGGVRSEFRKTVNATLQITGASSQASRKSPPEIKVRKMKAEEGTGRQAAVARNAIR